MSNTTALFAFVNPEISSLESFVELVSQHLGAHANICVGIATDGEDPDLGGVELFPGKTSVAAMLNQMAARTESPVLLINDGVVLPQLSADFWLKLTGLTPGSFLAVDSRRPVSNPDFADGDFHGFNWREVEFNRNVHEESPLSFAVSRSDFLRIRGFDENSIFDSCRTMDFLARLRRAGSVRRANTDLASFSLDVQGSFPIVAREKIPLTVSMRENQKAQVQSDGSIYRNLETWSVPQKLRPVLVSVSIATRDRAAYLSDSINSVLAQAFEDFELIVVDDGSEDDTESVVRSFEDTRIKYLRQDASGISAARNLAADHSRGYFTAVHDDDDLMLPWRLSTSLKTISADEQATYGSWVNFDDETAEMALHITKRNFGRDLIAHSGQTPGHATWLLPTSMVRSIRYDETLTSSVDHNLAVRTVLSGLRWKHSEQVLFLRRIHPTQVSQTDSRRQRAAAILTRYANGFNADFASTKTMAERGKALTFPAPADKATLFEKFGAYLPDHLVERDVLIQGLVGKKVLALDFHDRFDFIAAETDLRTDRSQLELGGASHIIWEDIANLRRKGIVGCRFKARKRVFTQASKKEPTVSPTVEMVIGDRQARELRSVTKNHPGGAVLRIESDVLSSESIENTAGLVSAKHFSINFGDYERRRFILLGFRSLELARAFITNNSHWLGPWQVLLPSTRDFSDVAEKHLGMI